MKVLHSVIIGVALVSLTGCGILNSGNKNIDYQSGAGQVPSLEIPPDLTTPETDDRYKVAEGEGESVATYSAYSKAGAATSPRSAVASAVLPVVAGVSLERNGTQRWLKVNNRAENVWPVVKAFLQENKMPIKSEDQAAGVIETDWAENRVKTSQDGIRGVFDKVLDNINSSGERSQYRVRLERSQDGASTEIYVTHRGMEVAFDENNTNSKWQAHPNDPEMEALLLQRLMVRFGGSPVAVAAAAGTPAATGSANLLEIFDGSSVIVINDTFDKSWRRVGLAVEHAGLVVEDKDRAKGVYFLRSAKAEKGWMDTLQFWKGKEDADVRYRVNVKDGGASCEVSVTDQNGISSDASRQRLEAIFKNINQ